MPFFTSTSQSSARLVFAKAYGGITSVLCKKPVTGTTLPCLHRPRVPGRNDEFGRNFIIQCNWMIKGDLTHMMTPTVPTRVQSHPDIQGTTGSHVHVCSDGSFGNHNLISTVPFDREQQQDSKCYSQGTRGNMKSSTVKRCIS